MSEIPAKVSDLGLVRRPLEDDEDAEQFKPLEWGLIRRMFTYARPADPKISSLMTRSPWSSSTRGADRGASTSSASRPCSRAVTRRSDTPTSKVSPTVPA